MRIYLSGPMTGHPDWNYPAFHAAAERLRKLGHTVYNPADSAKSTEHTSRAEFLRDDLKLLAGSDWPPAEGICLLPGWERSAGSRMELHVALELGLVVFIETLPGHQILRLNPDDARAELLDAVVDARAPKHIELTPKRAQDDRDAVEFPLRPGVIVRSETTTMPPLVESAAQEAHRLVHGNRGADYGHPLDDFTRTAALWTAQFRHLLAEGKAFGFREVWQAMGLLKLSREANKPKRDNRVDLAGYAETGQMCEDEAARRGDKAA